jgi:hypothetical protein
MGRFLMHPQHLGDCGGPSGGFDATRSQTPQSLRKSYLFKPLPYTLHLGHIPVANTSQGGRDWSPRQTSAGLRSRSNTWKNSSNQSQHSVFWPSWRPVTGGAQSKNTWPPSPWRHLSRSSRCLAASITDYTAGRGQSLAPLLSRGSC